MILKQLEGFEKYVAILGLRGVKIDNVEGFIDEVNKRLRNVVVQFFNARLVAGWEHLYFAALNALTAFKNKSNVSKSLAMEALLYASAQHQIKKALELFGIKPHTTDVAVLILAEELKGVNEAIGAILELTSAQEDDVVLKLTEEKFDVMKRAFGISDLELKVRLSRGILKEDALKDLVIEHMALLITQL